MDIHLFIGAVVFVGFIYVANKVYKIGEKRNVRRTAKGKLE